MPSVVRFDSLDPLRGGRSVVFEGRVRTIEAWSEPEVMAALAEIERAVESGLHAAGFVCYEAAPAMEPALAVHPHHAGFPLLWFTLYQERLESPPIDESSREPGDYRLGDLGFDIDRSEYVRKVEEIRELIAAGDTYQVNFSFRGQASFGGSELALYRDLCRAQRSAFCAFLELPDHTIVSASPELFFRRTGRRIELRPMKGTRPRGRWIEEDDALAAELERSPKDRAENLMIVDLLRNDLGRIAEFGSVRVGRLYEVERYPTVHQLTSTIEGQLRERIGLAEIFRALFPSGSVTGAPKIRTTEIIRDMEASPRGVYTGAIGFASADEAVFSVAIRTALLDRRAGSLTLGVGSGITADSDGDAEYRECLGKAAFLRYREPEFALLETILLEVPGGFPHLEAHLERIAASARYFGYPLDDAAIRRGLREASRRPPGRYKLRLLAERDGGFSIECQAISPEANAPRLRLAGAPVDETDPFLFHKTTHREVYRRALDGAADVDDVILHNSRGELTETTIANLVLELDGKWVTPPVRCGLLGGVYRAKLVEEGEVEERVLRKEDLSRASRILLTNAVRGMVAGVLLSSGGEAKDL